MSLIQHELGHFFVFLLLYFVIFQLVPQLYKLKYFLVGLITTIFMDLDHLLEYFLYAGFKFDPQLILSGDYFILGQKIIVLFHAWELVFLLVLLQCSFIKRKFYNYIPLVIALGIFAHLLFDIYTYDFDLLNYSIIYRSISDFSFAVFN